MKLGDNPMHEIIIMNIAQCIKYSSYINAFWHFISTKQRMSIVCTESLLLDSSGLGNDVKEGIS